MLSPGVSLHKKSTIEVRGVTGALIIGIFVGDQGVHGDGEGLAARHNDGKSSAKPGREDTRPFVRNQAGLGCCQKCQTPITPVESPDSNGKPSLKRPNCDKQSLR